MRGTYRLGVNYPFVFKNQAKIVSQFPLCVSKLLLNRCVEHKKASKVGNSYA